MRILSFLLLIVFIFPQAASAQSLTDGINDAPELELQPAYPNPKETVTITFSEYRSGMIGSTADWFYNGIAIPEAKDKYTVQVIAPKAGEVATVRLVLTRGGITETHTATIKPVYLDIIVEPQTHTPDFYLGRALPSIGSQINVTALLNNGKALDANYIYLWKINDAVYQGSALRNQNKISFPMPQGSNATLSLQVLTYEGAVIAKRTLSLPSAKPELHFYEINPLYGIETKAISKKFNFVSNSATLRSEPYYLDSVVFNTPSILDWTVNGQEVTSDNSNPYEITLERTGNPGDATLGFQVRSLSQLLQGTKGGITINI